MSENVVLGFTNPDYENIRVLNRLGGTGDLFVAHKKGMNIDVVIKRTQLQYQHIMNQENESSILKSLKHQYLPRIYDVLSGNDGCVYTVMDLISGQNLQQYVEQNGPVNQKECYRWACQLCEVMQYLHQENNEKPAIIHCDIKPGNVMITNSGDICLIDFNTSLIFRRDKTAVGVTDGYAAPEQYQVFTQSRPQHTPQMPTVAMPENRVSAGSATVPMGAATVPLKNAQESGVTVVMDAWTPPMEETVPMPQSTGAQAQPDRQKDYGPISMATDLYAVGATLYYAVTGHAPEKSLGEVTPLEHYRPKISRSMQTIIVRAMQKQQTRRFQQASEMLRALKNIDQMDLGYKKCQFRKRVTAVVLAACFAASAYSCYYGVERMHSERENVYLLNLAQADQAEQNLEYDTARELLDSAVSSGNLTKKNMDSVSVEQMHFIKGNCYIELKDYANAVRELQTAVSTQGASTDSYRSFAIALANDGKMKEAQSTLETLQERGASSGDCDLVAAEIKSLQKQNSEALALYEKVLDEVTDPQLLSHAYLAAARTALNMEDTAYAERILERGCQALPESQTVLEKEMLVDIQLQQAAADKQNAEQNYKKAEQLLRELVESGYATISTKLNLATVLQALNQYQEADDILTELAQQYPLDYRFDMQRAYLLIDWQGTNPAEKREYQLANDCYESAVQKYRQAQANGTEDAQMTVLKNLIDQLYTSGWLK